MPVTTQITVSFQCYFAKGAELYLSATCLLLSYRFFLFCGRGTPLYKLYMFPREGFLSYFDVKMGLGFSHFDLKFGIVFKGTTQTY